VAVRFEIVEAALARIFHTFSENGPPFPIDIEYAGLSKTAYFSRKQANSE
jgi:hypothetical protein